MSVAPKYLVVPPELEGLLVVENCEDFPLNRYMPTQELIHIFNDISEARKVTKEMNALGLSYMNSTLLYGPPGTGKTTFARYMANQLNLDFAYVSFANLIDGIFGNTARNIHKIFEFMAKQECVFMIDEIDAIAVKRGQESESTGGELSRITISIMQEMDYYRTHKIDAILIAATNRVDRLDDALRSRFSVQYKLNGMTVPEKEKYILRYLDALPQKIPYDPRNIHMYAVRNALTTTRNIESDLNRCIVAWIRSGKTTFDLQHIQSQE